MQLTLDSIKDVKVFQPKRGYRFSVDALLLEDFIRAKRLGKGLELGAGSGIISVLLAKRYRNARITAVELQKNLAYCAEKNVRLNRLSGNIEVVTADIRTLRKLFPVHSFDFVFSNPPFRKPRTGLLSHDKGRAVARHEVKMTILDCIQAAAYLLKNGGRLYLIYHPVRLIELIGLLKAARLEPKKMKFVHSRVGEEAKMVLIEAVKDSGTWLKIDSPLYIYENGNQYTSQMKRVYSQ